MCPSWLNLEKGEYLENKWALACNCFGCIPIADIPPLVLEGLEVGVRCPCFWVTAAVYYIYLEKKKN